MDKRKIKVLIGWSLFLIINKLISSESQCLKDEPRCDCSINRIDCINKSLNRIPSGFPSTTKQIHLNDNQITVIRRGELIGLPLLSSVNFYNNHISHIESKAFYNLSLLEDIVLNNNNLQQILRWTFLELKVLFDIYLQNNNISVIHREAFVSLPKLRSIYLTGNVIHCTCLIEWFAQYLNAHPIISQRSATQCAYPPDLEGKEVTLVNFTRLNCDTHSSIAVKSSGDSTIPASYYLATGLVLGMLISTVSYILLRKRKHSRCNGPINEEEVDSPVIFTTGCQMSSLSSLRDLVDSSMDNVTYYSHNSGFSGDLEEDPTCFASGYETCSGSPVSGHRYSRIQRVNSDYEDIANVCRESKSTQTQIYRRPTV
ncbi:slit homolog 2 protein-like [Saccostrea cucullata]|uniref:slit homolog 2 protein-like n=1 Tax=Saccostrea cuccullata TaxID=36930 RepID=UPI002ED37042